METTKTQIVLSEKQKHDMYCLKLMRTIMGKKQVLSRSNTYYKSDFKNDIDWLAGYGIDREEAKDYIKHLLDCKKEGF